VLDALWGRRAQVELRTLDVHVGRLRRALGDDGTPGLIRTVRGAGYTLEPAAG
jgi:two-component system phosphate regulon response regulator PhoB